LSKGQSKELGFSGTEWIQYSSIYSLQAKVSMPEASMLEQVVSLEQIGSTVHMDATL